MKYSLDKKLVGIVTGDQEMAGKCYQNRIVVKKQPLNKVHHQNHKHIMSTL